MWGEWGWDGGGPHQQLLVVIVERLEYLEELSLGQLYTTAGRVRARRGGRKAGIKARDERRRRCTCQAHDTVCKSDADSLVCPCRMVKCVVTAVALQVAHKGAANLQGRGDIPKGW